jgi:glucokinase
MRAVELFLDVYGAEAGNLALKVLPKGGLYVAGGVAPRLLPKLREGRFLEAFRTKGRMSPLLEATRVSVVTNTRVGLFGALHAALSRD